MTAIIIGIAIGALAKTLLPWPQLDDKVRSFWKSLWAKVD